MKLIKGSAAAKAYMAKIRAKKTKVKKVGSTTKAKKTYNKDVEAYKYFVVLNNKVQAGYEFKSDALDVADDFSPKAKVLTLQGLKKLGIKDPRNDFKYKLGATLIIEPGENAKSKVKRVILRKRTNSGTFESFSDLISGYKQTPEIIVGKVGNVTVLKSLAPEVKVKITRGKKVSTNIIKNSKDTIEILRKFISSAKVQTQEYAVAVFLNNNNNVLAVYQFGMGGFTGTVMDKRLLMAAALKLGATAIILCHNHPSGSLRPSEADKSITKQISEVARLHDIAILDHIIITKDGYYSFAENGIM
jgi:DNA repair protein RadC